MTGISIHAPTRGATLSKGYTIYPLPISIHAPTRGATTMPGVKGKTNNHFNPRSHTGSDMRSFGFKPFVGDFNPRSHTGSDAIEELKAIPDYHFNPRSHTGSDRATQRHDWPPENFNPRSHTGSDRQPGCPFAKTTTFQSTLPHGERHRKTNLAHAPFVFQSTLPHGERPVGFSVSSSCQSISIHAPTRGATSWAVFIVGGTRYFNPRSHTGSDTH